MSMVRANSAVKIAGPRHGTTSIRVASKSSGTNSPRTWSSACANGPRSACARGVSSIRAPTRTRSGSPMRSRSRCNAWLVAGCDRWIRIAARLTLASSSSASSATSRFRSSEDKFISRIYIILTIDWKNDVCAAMMGDHFRYGDAAMSAIENKKLMQEIFTSAGHPDPAVRDRALFTASLADDAKWTVTGQYSWSRSFIGKESILNDLHGHVRSLLVERARTVAR